MRQTEITEIEAKNLMHTQQAVLLDVRSLMEYQEGHIQKAIHIPLEKIAYEIEEMIENKQQPIVLYCRSGMRTKTARMILENLGYKKIYDLGGIYKWSECLEK
ncbi:MAG: rhodanese-like domain-containing protein [Cellulosilyticaceae bacterium]